MKFNDETIDLALFDLCRVSSNCKEDTWDNPSDACIVLTTKEANKLGVRFLNTNSPLDDFDVGEDIFVAILPDGRKFVVNSEGYNYARYYARLEIVD